VPENGTFLHVNANTLAAGAVVSPNPGAILKAVVLNTAGAAGNVLTVYDGSSTTVPPARIIAVVNTTNAAIPTLEFDVYCSIGIWYTLLTGTAADLTFVYD